jgi:hypothetical protein
MRGGNRAEYFHPTRAFHSVAGAQKTVGSFGRHDIGVLTMLANDLSDLEGHIAGIGGKILMEIPTRIIDRKHRNAPTLRIEKRPQKRDLCNGRMRKSATAQ